MGYLREIDADEADGTVAELYAADRAALGHVANYTRTFAPRPAVYRARFRPLHHREAKGFGAGSR